MDPALGEHGFERQQGSWEQQQNKQEKNLMNHLESRFSKAAVTRSSKKKKKKTVSERLG